MQTNLKVWIRDKICYIWHVSHYIYVLWVLLFTNMLVGIKKKHYDTIYIFPTMVLSMELKRCRMFRTLQDDVARNLFLALQLGWCSDSRLHKCWNKCISSLSSKIALLSVWVLSQWGWCISSLDLASQSIIKQTRAFLYVNFPQPPVTHCVIGVEIGSVDIAITWGLDHWTVMN